MNGIWYDGYGPATRNFGLTVDLRMLQNLILNAGSLCGGS